MPSLSVPVAPAPTKRSAILIIAHRIVLSLFGSYVFTWGCTAFGIAVLTALGVNFYEAETVLLILAFLIIVPVFLWAFAAQSIGQVWLILVGGAISMTAAAWLIQKLMLS